MSDPKNFDPPTSRYLMGIPVQDPWEKNHPGLKYDPPISRYISIKKAIPDPSSR